MSRIDYSSCAIWIPLKNFTCQSGKLRTEFTSRVVKSTSPVLSDTTFFALCSANRALLIIIFSLLCWMERRYQTLLTKLSQILTAECRAEACNLGQLPRLRKNIWLKSYTFKLCLKKVILLLFPGFAFVRPLAQWIASYCSGKERSLQGSWYKKCHNPFSILSRLNSMV